MLPGLTGDTEHHKEGHPAPSGAVTPFPQPAPLRAAAREAINVMPSPLDRSCQLKSPLPQLLQFNLTLVCIFHFHAAVRFAERLALHSKTLLHFKCHHRDQKTRPQRSD